jgi:putative membrane protein
MVDDSSRSPGTDDAGNDDVAADGAGTRTSTGTGTDATVDASESFGFSLDGATLGEYLGVYLKGVFMGAADTVPGVSGGTIALVTGIYERLITAITAVDVDDVGFVRYVLSPYREDSRRELFALARRVDLPFLLALGAGIGTAVVTVAGVIEAVMESSPAALSALFFGLIAASAVVLYGEVDLGTPRRVLVAVFGVVFAFLVAGVSSGGGGSPALPFVFVAGTIGISAMVLPGVSGAFLLLLLGVYEYLLGSVTGATGAVVGLLDGGSVDAFVAPGTVLVTFMAGAAVGLLTVAHAIRWALDRYRAATLTFLVSLMVGGLRLPAEDALTQLPTTTTGRAVVVLAAVVGAVGVLLFDYYTDDLDY